jgi:cytosine/adenosine deaminase-related metal-dependent hydrolase
MLWAPFSPEVLPLARLLLHGGHLVDPAHGWNGPADLLFEDGRVAAVGPELPVPRGTQAVDVSGRLVLPGLVDTHVHVARGRWPGHVMMARAGVTTALNLSGQMSDVVEGLKRAGAGLSIASLDSLTPGLQLPDDAPSRQAIEAAVEQATRSGAIGVKILGGHQPFTPAATAQIIRSANEQRAYVAFHVGTTRHGSDLAGLREAVELADGLSLHLAHINSYCRGAIRPTVDEAQEAIALLTASPRLRSESYLALINGTSGRCRDGEPVSNVTKSCLQRRGYPPTEEGLAEALQEGWAQVGDSRGDEMVLLTGEAAYELWRELGTDVGLSFAVNDPTSQFILATARRPDGRFAVDALSTDGGGLPRNVTVDRGLALVAFGALSLDEFVRKAALTPARMIGLHQKGHLGVGADADLAVVDPLSRRVHATYVAGRPIMVDGIVLGSGGTVLTTTRGERALRASGLPVQTLTLTSSALYRPEQLGE